MIKLNYEYPARPIETFLNGVPTDADSLSYRIYRNGVAESDPASLVATSDKIADGLKFATLTTLGLTDGWATTDSLLGFVDAVINGETYSTLFFDSTAIAAEGSAPYSAHAPQRVNGTKLTAFLNEGSDVSIVVTCYDADGEPLSLNGLSLTAIVASDSDPDTPLATPQSFTGSGSTFSLTLNTAFTSAVALAGQAHHWSLRDGTEVIQRGRLEVLKTASASS